MYPMKTKFSCSKEIRIRLIISPWQKETEKGGTYFAGSLKVAFRSKRSFPSS